MKRFFFCLLATVCCIAAQGQVYNLDQALLLNEKGSRFMDEGRFQEAAAAYRKALATYPPHADSLGRLILLHNLADALVSQRSFSAAVSVMDQMDGLPLEGEFGMEMRNLKANLLSASGRTSEALSLWKDIIRDARKSRLLPLYTINAATTALEANESLWASSIIRDALEVTDSSKDSVELYRLLALASFNPAYPENAHRQLDRAHAMAKRLYERNDYDYLVLESTKAQILEREGKYSEAVQSYQAAAKGLAVLFGQQHPAVFSALYGKARCLLGMGDDKEAVSTYLAYADLKQDYLSKEVSRLNPADLRAYWINNREGVVDAPLFAEVANAPALDKILDMVLLSKSFTFDCLREVTTTPSWKAVAKRMPAGSVAIEFVDYSGLDGSAKSGAFLFRNNSRDPIFIPLPLAVDLYWNPKQADSITLQALYDSVWAPLMGFIQADDTVYFCPSASMSRLPLEYGEDSAGNLLCNKVAAAVRMLTTRDIPTKGLALQFKKAILFGNMLYDPAASRGIAVNWPQLKWSETEISDISTALTSIPTTLYLAENATEDAFRSNAFPAGTDALLYLSTHGMYLSAGLASQLHYFQERYDKRALEDNPLLRSVLIFSGATGYWGNDNISQEKTDQTLSAQEISEMDLSGVSLAVLAACQTGLSDTDPETLGFPRAFKLAGAKATIVSLWTVNDHATAILMAGTVKRIAAGMTPEKALQTEIGLLRKDKQFSDPYYWAPFVIYR